MGLTLIERTKLLAHIARWRITWKRHDLDAAERVPGNPRFMSAREAVRLIPDGGTIVTSGLAANGRCSVWFWAIREAYLRHGRPRGLFWISAGAQGSRGRVPGTIEECAVAGLMRTYCTGHWETAKAQMRLIDRGELEMQVLPQGIIALLLDAQARGESTIVSDTGIGTFMDPRVGRGSVGVAGPRGEQLVSVEGDRLRYRLPPVTVSAFVLPYADREGNVYAHDAAMTTEARESALAARRNGGVVLASVAKLIEKDPARIFLPADAVDAVVVHPYNEQTGSVPQLRFWPLFAEGADGDPAHALAQLKFANNVLGITPRRSTLDDATARLGAHLVAGLLRKGMYINTGVGLPEEVARHFNRGGLWRDVTFLTETGNVGGIPAMGIFFGAMVYPKRLISSAEMFKLTYDKLDMTMLGMLQVDSDGNVNVSKRGDGAIHYVGPGGLIDLVRGARTALFVGKFMEGAEMRLQDGRVQMARPGKRKFVAHVDEITMNGRNMLALGKRLLYATNVGAFELTPRGLELRMVFPGIDVQRDVLANAGARIVLPETGTVPLVPPEVVTGEGFRLELAE